MDTSKPSAADVAKDLQPRVGSSIGVLSFWGIQPVRPHDEEYKLTAVAAQGEKLVLTLQGYETTTLAVWRPVGVKASKDSLQIKSAVRVTWTFGNWDLRVEGGKLLVRGGASTDEDERAVPKDPAVSLKKT